MRRPLQQWLISSHIFVLLLPLGALVATGALSRDLQSQARISMLDQGALVALMVQQQLEHSELVPSEELADLIQNTATAAHASVGLFNSSGTLVVGAVSMDAQAVQNAVEQALQGQQGWQHSGANLAVTNPIMDGDQIVGVVALTQSPRQTQDAIVHMAPRLSAGLLAALVLTLMVSGLIGLAQARALRILAGTARRIADGELAAIEQLSGPLSSRTEEVHMLATAFGNMGSRLQDRLSYIHEFASNVSHEFKTPLSTLRATLELLEEDDDMPRPQRMRFLGNALKEVHRMDAMVAGLLELARAEQSNHLPPMALQALLDDVVCRYPAVTLSGQAATICADHRQMEMLLLNLLDNAMNHGSPPIDVQAFSTPQHTGYAVTDAGEGISSGNRDRIFDRFFTTDRRQGTGLGLALAQTICESHGGVIKVESMPGRTTFTVTFPRTKAQSSTG